jgi:phage pi2 protein 07
MGIRLNLLNQKFGKLTVISEESKEDKTTHWRCGCECGRQVIVSTTSLRSGNTRSCGCLRRETLSKFKDLTGMRIGRLTVVKFHKYEYSKGLNRRNFWWCKCDCGKEKSINHYSLCKEKTLSCGCLQREINIQKSHRPEAGFNKVYRSYTHRARKEGKLFSLNPNDFFRLTQENCNYCNTPPSQISKTMTPFIYNGIDRIDSNLGYTIENCVPCCKICNYAKGSMTVEQFKVWIMKVFKNYVE